MDFQFLINWIGVALGWIFTATTYIVLYVLSTISLYSIGKRASVKHLWIVFIPIVQYFIIGEICEEYQLLGFRIKRLGFVLVFLFVLELLLQLARSSLLLLVVSALKALIFHKFYSLFSCKHILLYTVLSTLGNIPLTIILFLIKDAPMYMSAAAYRYPFPDKM